MSAARRKAAVATALVSLAALLARPPIAFAQQSAPACGGPAAEIAMLAAPMAPWKGAPLRVILTGQAQTPSVDAVVALIGRETVMARLAAHL